MKTLFWRQWSVSSRRGSGNISIHSSSDQYPFTAAASACWSSCVEVDSGCSELGPGEGRTGPPKSWLGPKFNIHCRQLILGKNSKFDATRCQILRLKCTKCDFRCSCAADPAPLRELTALPQTPNCIYGSLLLRGGRGKRR